MSRSSVLLIGLVAVAVRLVAMALAFAPDVTFVKFFLAAERLIADGWLPAEPFAYSPAYIYLVAVLLSLGGGPTVLCGIQILLGAGTCIAIGAIGRRLSGPTTGLVAGLWAALFGPFLIYALDFESDTLGMFLYAVMAVAVLHVTRTPSTRGFLLTGALLGLRACQRPNALLLVPLLLLVWWLLCRPRWGTGPAARRMAAFTAAAALPVLVVTAINFRAGGEAIPVMSSGGWVFYTSHNHAATGLSYYPPPLALALMREPVRPGQDRLSRLDDAVSRRVAAIATGRELSPAEASRFWFREGAGVIWRRGWGQVGLQGRKLLYAFHDYEAHDNLALLVKQERMRWLLLLGMGTLAPLGLYGLAAAVRSCRLPPEEMWILIALLATPVVSMSVFYVGSRFRLELAAMLIPFAVLGVTRIARHVRARRMKSVVMIALVVGAGLVLLHVPDGEMDRQARSRRIQLLTFLGEQAGDPVEAERRFLAAADLAVHPAEAAAAFAHLARIAGERGDRQAQGRFERMARGELPPGHLAALRARRDDPDALWAIGRHLVLRGEGAQAAGVLEEARRLDPLDPDIAFLRALAAYQAGAAGLREIETWTREALELGLRFSPNAVDAHLLLARCHLRLGERDRAGAAVAEVLRLDPGNEAARRLAGALSGSGNME